MYGLLLPNKYKTPQSKTIVGKLLYRPFMSDTLARNAFIITEKAGNAYRVVHSQFVLPWPMQPIEFWSLDKKNSSVMNY